MIDLRPMVEMLDYTGIEGIGIDGLFAAASAPDYDGDSLMEIRGELQAPGRLPFDVRVEAIVNDAEGRVVEHSQDYFDAESFIGFGIFTFSFYLKPGQVPARIRLVVRPS